MSTEQGSTSIDTRHITYNTSSSASKGLMNLQRPLEQSNARGFSAEPVSLFTRTETRDLKIQVNNESQAAHLEVPAKISATSSEKQGSETSSVTSYDSDKEKNSPKFNKGVAVVDIKEEKKAVPTANTHKQEAAGTVEVKGFGNRDHYLSEGFIVFRVLDAKFRESARLEAKNKPYIKFRLGLNTKNSKSTVVEGKTLKVAEEIKVKYTNQDQVRIKVKGKGALIDNVIARTKVSIVDVVMEGKQNVWAPLLKGDEVIGEIHLSMEFAPKK